MTLPLPAVREAALNRRLTRRNPLVVSHISRLRGVTGVATGATSVDISTAVVVTGVATRRSPGWCMALRRPRTDPTAWARRCRLPWRA